MRPVRFERGFVSQPAGSCLAVFGETKVICTASIEPNVPPWMVGSGRGWVTAEYAMLPRATTERTPSERRGPGGRTQEIQRLIGRSLRTITDLKALGEIQVRVDCDVLQADGGSRTASITGAYVALYRAFQKVAKAGLLKQIPLKTQVGAVSCGIVDGRPVLDLDYQEDSSASTDANFVLTDGGDIVEIQATAETDPMTDDQFGALLGLARKGVSELAALQRAALGLT